MTTFSISDFREALVEFEATHMQSAQTVWMNSDALVKSTDDKDWSKEKFVRQFAYGIEGTLCFADITFDKSKKKTFSAERYGGIGLVDNGGGARCGTMNLAQIKGIGPTPLVGGGSDPWHAYGGLGMTEAVAELINSIVFERILPVGTVPCYGLIYTGRNTACTFPPMENGRLPSSPGALLVRENCIRPAHFFRNGVFTPSIEFKEKICGDVHRTRQVNRTLFSKFSDKIEFINFIGKFLSSNANQFAFAQIFRIRHGTMSPSNISFDGRWLDLTYTGFIDSGKNYSALQHLTSFHEEPMFVLQIMQEFFYTFEKYNGTTFDTRPLIKYYLEELNSYVKFYSARLLGLSPDAVNAFMDNATYSRLVVSLMETIKGDKKPVLGGPNGLVPDDDPIMLLVEQLFRSLKPGNKLTLTRQNISALYVNTAFKAVFEHCFSARSNTHITHHAYLINAAIKSLRKLYFSCFYYALESTFVLAREVAHLDDQGKGSDYIDEFCDVSTWLFDDIEGAECLLFKSRKLKICFDAEQTTYTLQRVDKSAIENFYTAIDLKNALKQLPESALCIHHFNFRKNLLRMLDLLAEFDDMPS